MEQKIIKDAKLVFNAGCARKLLHAGCTLIDIKPDKSNSETGKEKSVFVFKCDEQFYVEFDRINKEIAAKKEFSEQ